MKTDGKKKPDKDLLTTMYFRGLPRQLCQQFAAAVVLRGLTQKDVLIEYMKEFVREANKVQPGRKV